MTGAATPRATAAMKNNARRNDPFVMASGVSGRGMTDSSAARLAQPGGSVRVEHVGVRLGGGPCQPFRGHPGDRDVLGLEL